MEKLKMILDTLFKIGLLAIGVVMAVFYCLNAGSGRYMEISMKNDSAEVISVLDTKTGMVLACMEMPRGSKEEGKHALLIMNMVDGTTDVKMLESVVKGRP